MTLLNDSERATYSPASERQGRNSDGRGEGTPTGGDQMRGSRRARYPPEGRHDHGERGWGPADRATPKGSAITRGAAAWVG